MEMNFEDLLEKITDFLKSEAKTETVVGDQFKLGEFTCVPVIRVGMGFGSGGGSGNDTKSRGGEGGAAGFGMGMEPIGFLVTRGGEISFIGVSKSSKGISAAFEKIPDIVDKILSKKDSKPEKPNA